MSAHLAFAPFLYFGRRGVVRDAGSLSGRTLRTGYVLIQVIDGAFAVESHGRSWNLRAGQASILPPASQVSWRVDTHYIHLGFDLVPGARHAAPSGLPEVARNRNPQPAWRDLFGVDLPMVIDPDFLARHQARIERLSQATPRYLTALLRANANLSMLIADYVAELRDDEKTEVSNSFLSRVETVLIARHAKGITMAEVAATIGCSQEHLSRAYRQERGCTPSDFLQRHRVAKACKLLRAEPTATLAAIATAVGFPSANALGSHFKRIMGTTPGQWRREA